MAEDAQAGAPTTASADAVPAVDPHASKLSPDDPRVRIRPSGSRRLRKGRVIVALFCVGLIVVSGLAYATSSSPETTRKKLPPAPTWTRATVPDAILRAPEPLTKAPVVEQNSQPKSAPGSTKPLPVPTRAEVFDSAHDGTSYRARGAVVDRDASEVRRRRQEAVDAARASSMLFNVGPMPGMQANGSTERTSLDNARASEHDVSDAAQLGAIAAPDGQAGDADPNLQAHKQSFTEAVGSSRADSYLHTRLEPPRSPYELKAGTIIPGMLETGISSDLPGPVFARVREDVYDSITHEHLLIPQNSTLIAAYDSMIAWGQQRVLLCWQRLILPNGSSLQLECAPGADLTGAAGLTDDVDEHWWRILKGAGVASLLSAATTASAGNVSGYNPTVPQLWARGAANEIGNVGQQLTRRNMMVQPTITVRPGWSINVMVTKDMILEPYDATP